MLAANEKYLLEMVEETDVERITAIYNSNKAFFIEHLGKEEVTVQQIADEWNQMKKISFYSCKIIDKTNHKMIGFCDFKLGKTTYLSLFMLDGMIKGNGIGKEIYGLLELYFMENQCEMIRIDVVFDYSENVVGFWLKCGFEIIREIELEWNGKRSLAYMMTKALYLRRCDWC